MVATRFDVVLATIGCRRVSGAVVQKAPRDSSPLMT